MVGFEKEINSLLRKIESRKGRGVKVVGGKKKSFLATHLEREILKLECPGNYDCSFVLVKVRGRGFGGPIFFFLRSISLIPIGFQFLCFRRSPMRSLFLARL